MYLKSISSCQETYQKTKEIMQEEIQERKDYYRNATG